MPLLNAEYDELGKACCPERMLAACADVTLICTSLERKLATIADAAVVVQVANNRYSIFGKTATCRNSDERYQERFIA